MTIQKEMSFRGKWRLTPRTYSRVLMNELLTNCGDYMQMTLGEDNST